LFHRLRHYGQSIPTDHHSNVPLYAVRYLHLSPSQVGMLFTISGVVIFAMMIPAGFLMDRVGRKWCTVPSTGIPALIFFLIPMTSSFMQLALLIGIAGVAQGLSLGSLATSTYDVVPAHARGRLQALRRTIAELGGAARSFPLLANVQSACRFGLCAAAFAIGDVSCRGQ
jgi:MFS family permease